MVSTQEFQRKVRNELERLFRAIDSDGSGALSSTEFDAASETLIQVLGATSQDAPATAILKGLCIPAKYHHRDEMPTQPC